MIIELEDPKFVLIVNDEWVMKLAPAQDDDFDDTRGWEIFGR